MPTTQPIARVISEADLDTLALIHHAHANALQALLNINQDDARVKRWNEQFQSFRDLYTRLHRGEPHGLTQAARDVLAERARQINVYELTAERDDQYKDGELAAAAGCYALHTKPLELGMCPAPWPWDAAFWKPTTPRRALVKSAALALAEIERMDRADSQELEEAIRNAPADSHAIEHKGEVVFLNRGTSESDWIAMANTPHGELQAEVVSIKHLAGEIRLQLPAGAEVPQDLESGMQVDVLYTAAAADPAAEEGADNART
ncbi:MAG: hypothetical protein ACO1PM_08250 [Acidovorax sp.]